MTHTPHAPRFGRALPSLGMGCWSFAGGQSWGGVSDETAVQAVHAALDNGVTFFDVAPAYGNGHAEEVLGEALRRAGAAGREATVATKCGVRLGGRHGRIDNSPDWIRQEVDMSLRRLRVEAIDLYQVHWPDAHTPVRDTLEALAGLRDEGKVRAIGLSNHSREETAIAAREYGIVSFQGLYNLLERNPTFYHTLPLAYRSEAEIIPLCVQEGLAFLPYSPLMQGLLAGAWGPDHALAEDDVRTSNPKLRQPRYAEFHALVSQLNSVAHEAGHPLAGLAIAWLVAQPGMGPVIAASTRPAHIAANAAAAQLTLGADVLARIDKVLEPYRDLLDR